MKRNEVYSKDITWSGPERKPRERADRESGGGLGLTGKTE